MRFPQFISVDGVTRRVVWPDEHKRHYNKEYDPQGYGFLSVYLDSESLPGRPCSCHSLRGVDLAHIAKGGRVRGSGHTYAPADGTTAY